MSLFIYFLQFLERGMYINLSGLQAVMSQKLLNGTKLGIMIEHGGGKGVTQYVRALF